MGVGTAKAKPQQQAEAVDWFVREIAFTHLNRLVALKRLEVRDLIPEIITTREAYGGRSRAQYDYRNAHPDQARQPDDALPAAIRHTCRRVFAEFRFLFDVGDPSAGHRPPANSILWPSYPVLKDCIALINDLDTAANNDGRTLWSEDEIIGWIYQFYNAEHKQAIRKRGKPRRPAEVAVINQFFTPRWIVKFLVDNTLGRLWLEMHPDSERVRAKCDYLVPEPLPSPTPAASGVTPSLSQSSGEGGGRGEGEGFALDPDSPINNPKAPPRREPKRPQDIPLIDPACGTMHFGHYAFEVFQEIYRDARDRGWVTGEDALPDEEIPAAILRYNLYGVDIDLRAVQLAGLSLFIKAKSANPDAHISHVNLVVADAVLPADGARQRFLAQYKDDKVVQDAVRQVLEKMENVAEVGSLLRVEERLRDILAKAGHEAVREWDAKRQRELPGFEPETRQLSLAEISGVVPEQWGAHYTLARLLDDLRAFAAEALQTHDLNAQLFAEEAEKSVHLLDVFLNDHDVVVMNPPYGRITSKGKRQVHSAYPRKPRDVYDVFFERALDLLAPTGLVGALTSRTFLGLSSCESLRTEVILPQTHLPTLLDLGFGILDDAMVETAATVLRKSIQDHEKQDLRSIFFRLTAYNDDEGHHPRFTNALSKLLNQEVMPEEVFLVPYAEFSYLPGSKIAYWASSNLRKMFAETPSFEPTCAIVRAGKETGDNERFLRRWWEVPVSGIKHRWIPFAKGGDYSKYYYDIDLLIDWSSGAQKLHAEMGNSLPNLHHYFKEGLTYPISTVKGFNVRFLPANCIFSNVGAAVLFDDNALIWPTLALMNSSTFAALLKMVIIRNFEVGYVGSVPYVKPDQITNETLQTCASIGHALRASWDTGNETCTRFGVPWLIQAHQGIRLAGTTIELETPNLQSLLDYLRTVEPAADARLQQLQTQIDEVVYNLYEISPEDRALIERELGDRPPELVWPQMERKSDEEKRREHVRRLVSYFLLQALKEKRDGILPLTPGTGQTTALDEVRRRMEVEFGEEAAFRMETEIKQVLGRGIADWLNGPFFKWHTKLYKKRPIIWHLSSPRSTFACFVHIHKLDRDTLRKVQTLYLWPRRRAVETELEAARAAKATGERGAARRIDQAEAVLDDLAEFEKRLLAVIQGEVACDTPDWAEGPYRGGVYDPVLDDGVKVNIMPLQGAGVLRYRKVV